MDDKNNEAFISGGVLEWPDTYAPEWDTHDRLGEPWMHMQEPSYEYP